VLACGVGARMMRIEVCGLGVITVTWAGWLT
jgi:hypothetical protein